MYTVPQLVANDAVLTEHVTCVTAWKLGFGRHTVAVPHNRCSQSDRVSFQVPRYTIRL